MKNDYEIIKKKYSERFAKACRTLFPTIMENNGELSDFLLSTFAPNPYIYEDVVLGKIDTFRNFVNSHFNRPIQPIKTTKSVRELFEEVGYDFFECKTNEDVLSFKHYYYPGEAICTFNDKSRIDHNHIFFAVKKNANQIKRENFNKPFREDEYGTSVISIQFLKGEDNELSIKNRYNSSVTNPDATFSNNLDNIIPGLTYAFEQEYGLNINKPISTKLELEGYKLANDGRYYKYNYDMKGVYYCSNNVLIKNGEVVTFNPSCYRLVDYYLIDLQNKKIDLLDDWIKDSFACEHFDKFDIEKRPNSREYLMTLVQNNEKTVLEVDDLGRIIGIGNNHKTKIEDNYLSNNKYIKVAVFPNVEEIGNYFMMNNTFLSRLYLDNVQSIGDNCLRHNERLTHLYLPRIKRIGQAFLYYNDALQEIAMPDVESIGSYSFMYNDTIRYLDLPNLRHLSDGVFLYNYKVNINFPKLEHFGQWVFGGEMDITNKLIEEVNKNARRVNEGTEAFDEEVGVIATARK